MALLAERHTHKPTVPSSDPTSGALFEFFFNCCFVHVNHRKWEPEGVHGQLEGCNRNLRPQAAVAKVYTHGNKSCYFR